MNSSGQILIDMCIATGLRILNGKLGSDKGIGKTISCHATHAEGEVLLITF